MYAMTAEEKVAVVLFQVPHLESLYIVFCLASHKKTNN